MLVIPQVWSAPDRAWQPHGAPIAVHASDVVSWWWDGTPDVQLVRVVWVLHGGRGASVTSNVATVRGYDVATFGALRATPTIDIPGA